jgi:DNA-binding NarL/FixJ family response regulator
MRVYWERMRVLGPIYRLVGRGLNDREIADKLNITESKVHGCVSWMLHSFTFPNRMELARDFSARSIHSSSRVER